MLIVVDGQLSAVVTHPCTGGKWCVSRMGLWGAKKFKTKKAAVAHVKEALESAG